jgi:hypothetical protein
MSDVSTDTVSSKESRLADHKKLGDILDLTRNVIELAIAFPPKFDELRVAVGKLDEKADDVSVMLYLPTPKPVRTPLPGVVKDWGAYSTEVLHRATMIYAVGIRKYMFWGAHND